MSSLLLLLFERCLMDLGGNSVFLKYKIIRMAEKERKRQGIVNSTKLPFLHFEGKDLSKFRRIPVEFRRLEEKARKRKGKETDRCFLKHSIVQAKLFQVAPPSRFSNHTVHCTILVTGTQHKKSFPCRWSGRYVNIDTMS